jgi:hypothetical protein
MRAITHYNMLPTFLMVKIRKVSSNYKHVLIRNRKFMQPTLISFQCDGICQTNTAFMSIHLKLPACILYLELFIVYFQMFLQPSVREYYAMLDC